MDVCKGCGKCCKVFGKPSKANYVLCQSPVPGLFLFPWEYRRLKSEKMQVARQVFPDSKSKTNIVVGYIVKNQPCIFYKGACKIYKKRPLTCIAYPRKRSKDCPKKKIFSKSKDRILAAKMGEGLYNLCTGLINKYEIEGKIKIIATKKSWKFVDVDKFFKFVPMEFREARSRRLR
ncbi:MAG: YkgJ family cysteine cluster protein [Candidatus Woesearchaeota archaeon]